MSSGIQKELEEWLRSNNPTGSRQEKVRLLYETAMFASKELVRFPDDAVKELASISSRWPTISDLFSDTIGERDKIPQSLGFGIKFPIKNGLKRTALRVWIAEKIDFIATRRRGGKLSEERYARLSVEEEIIEDKIHSDLELCAENAREIGKLLVFINLIHSDYEGLIEFEYSNEMEYYKDVDVWAPVVSNVEYSEFLQGQVLDKAHTLARRVITKRIERASNSLEKENESPSDDHVARVYDLEEKIKMDEALLDGPVDIAYKNVESAFLESIVTELKTMLP